ncbi:hypothetical protein LCGC14_2077480, partial [marine sediment metagenome]
AQKVADMVRNYLATGGDGTFEGLSFMTKTIYGFDPPPLKRLARHIIVEIPKQRRNVKGQFQSGFHPAVITVEKGWERIAFTLDRGAIIIPTPKQRAMLFARVHEAYGKQLPENQGRSSGGVWVMPARPWSHLFASSDIPKIFQDVAETVFSGKTAKRDQQAPKEAWRDAYEEEFSPIEFVSWDDVSGVVQDHGMAGEGWDEMIEFD